ncbi:hypothetical protein [Dyadobacter sp. CY312]|uniref:hypothetical protein n=1 Tax=Dyadobacter sp. CY312 TaxID=2907303 RepID=UPI001F1DEFC9|nr:hypothetical protein [Dyadobacter sp. CY312]MCE7039229.1 hypothetical protein [Dyadobacter sp. CY312]
MKIAINPDTGISMFALDQMLMVRELRECYKHYGIHGLHYTVLFGWDGSPYKNELDLELRDKFVYDDVYSDDLYDLSKGKFVDNKKSRHRDMYKNPFIMAAIKTINALAKVPQLELHSYYEEQIAELKIQANISWKTGNTSELKAQAQAQNLLLANIKTLQKNQKEIADEIASTMKVQVVASLNDFIMNKDGGIGLEEEDED